MWLSDVLKRSSGIELFHLNYSLGFSPLVFLILNKGFIIIESLLPFITLIGFLSSMKMPFHSDYIYRVSCQCVLWCIMRSLFETFCTMTVLIRFLASRMNMQIHKL